MNAVHDCYPNKKPSAFTDGPCPSLGLPRVERPTLALVATASARVLPVHLDQPVMAAERLVIGAVPDRAGRWPEFPRAFVGVFLAAAVVPGIEIGIRNGLLGLVRHDRRHAIGPTVAIGTRSLCFASRWATIGISHEGILDIRPADGRSSMPSAVLCAEA